MISRLNLLFEVHKCDLSTQELKSTLNILVDQELQIEERMIEISTEYAITQQELLSNSKAREQALAELIVNEVNLSIPAQEEDGCNFNENNGLQRKLECYELEYKQCNDSLIAIRDQKNELKKNLEILNSWRQEVTVKLPSALLEFYDRLRTKKGNAIAEVKDKCCASCRIILTYTTLKLVNEGEQVKLCENCGRILIGNISKASEKIAVRVD